MPWCRKNFWELVMTTSSPMIVCICKRDWDFGTCLSPNLKITKVYFAQKIPGSELVPRRQTKKVNRESWQSRHEEDRLGFANVTSPCAVITYSYHYVLWKNRLTNCSVAYVSANRTFCSVDRSAFVFVHFDVFRAQWLSSSSYYLQSDVFFVGPYRLAVLFFYLICTKMHPCYQTVHLAHQVTFLFQITMMTPETYQLLFSIFKVRNHFEGSWGSFRNSSITWAQLVRVRHFREKHSSACPCFDSGQIPRTQTHMDLR